MKRVDANKNDRAMRVMKRVMKPLHHPSHATAPISIEMKVSSPPRLLPQAEGNFRQQHFLWQLTGGSAERFGSTASLAARTNYPQPAVAPASHCLSSGAGSLTLRAWGRTGALRLIALSKELGEVKSITNKKGPSLKDGPKFVKRRNGIFSTSPHHDLRNRKASGDGLDGLSFGIIQLTKQSVKRVYVYQRNVWIPSKSSKEIFHRKLLGNVAIDSLRRHSYLAPYDDSRFSVWKLMNVKRTCLQLTENHNSVKRAGHLWTCS
jgi:hypothetical protein